MTILLLPNAAPGSIQDNSEPDPAFCRKELGHCDSELDVAFCRKELGHCNCEPDPAFCEKDWMIAIANRPNAAPLQGDLMRLGVGGIVLNFKLAMPQGINLLKRSLLLSLP